MASDDTWSPTSTSSESSNELSDLDDNGYKDENVRICQYVHRVIDYSSQYGSDTSISYTAFNIVGRQSQYPDYGDFPETFAMRTYGRWWETSPGAPKEIMSQNLPAIPVTDFIIVEFEEYVIPSQVTIYETYNPGSVINIWAYVKHSEEWTCLWSGEPTLEKRSRRFSPPIKRIAFPTKIIRLEFNHSCLDYFTEIDAVLLKGMACFNRNSNRLNMLKLNSDRRGYILKRLENFEVKVGDSEQQGQQILKNFLENDLPEFVKDVQSSNEYKFTLADIPGEILLKIFSYLDLKSLFKVTQTCRKFYEVGTDPTLYREINLRPYWNLISDPVIVTLTQRATQLKKLDMSWCGLFNKISALRFKDFIKRCGSSLIQLRLNSCQFINVTCLEVVGQMCHNLRELSLRNYSGNNLNFHCVKNFRQLERLDLFRCNITSEIMLMLLKYNGNLRHLNLGIAPHLSMDDVAVQLSQTNTHLISLDMWKSHFLSSVGLKALANCQHLEEVDFGWCLRTEALPGEGLKTLLRNCRKLKKLFLAAIRGLSDRDLLVIAECCPELEQLDLMGVLGISQEGYFHILKHCHKLKLLDLSFCEPNDEIQIALWRDAFGVDIKGNFNANNQNLF